MRAEPVVEPDSLRDLDDVGADGLAHVGDLVDERDPRHQECVGGELDHLGRGDVRANDGRVDAGVQRFYRRAVLFGERTDDDPVRVEEVPHGPAFGEELRIRDVPDVRQATPLEGCAHLLSRPDRHRRLHHEDLPLVRRRQVVERRPNEGEIGVTRIRRRGLNAHEDRIRACQIAGVERVGDALAVSLEHLRQVRLVERELARP